MNIRSRRFHCVINNFTAEEEDKVRKLPDNPTVLFAIASEEHLDDPNETPHIHVYFEVKNAIHFSTVKKFTSERAHVESAKGNRQQNIDYVSKEGNIFVKYDPLEYLSSKEDREAKILLNHILNLETQDFINQHTAYYIKNFHKYDDLRAKYLHDKIQDYDGDLHKKNYWIYGPPGVGKSMLARRGLKVSQCCFKAVNKWFSGYQIAKTRRIIIDDWPMYDQSQSLNILIQHLKIWGDRYAFTGESKGSHVVVDPHCQVVITSNYSIDDCTPPNEDREAIKRRFNEIHILDQSDITKYAELFTSE